MPGFKYDLISPTFSIGSSWCKGRVNHKIQWHRLLHKAYSFQTYQHYDFLQVSVTLSNTQSATSHTLMFLQTVNIIAYSETHIKTISVFFQGEYPKEFSYLSELTFSGRLDYLWITFGLTELCILLFQSIMYMILKVMWNKISVLYKWAA